MCKRHTLDSAFGFNSCAADMVVVTWQDTSLTVRGWGDCGGGGLGLELSLISNFFRGFPFQAPRAPVRCVAGEGGASQAALAERGCPAPSSGQPRADQCGKDGMTEWDVNDRRDPAS